MFENSEDHEDFKKLIMELINELLKAEFYLNYVDDAKDGVGLLIFKLSAD